MNEQAAQPKLCEIHPDGIWPCPELCGEMCVWRQDEKCLQAEGHHKSMSESNDYCDCGSNEIFRDGYCLKCILESATVSELHDLFTGLRAENERLEEKLNRSRRRWDMLWKFLSIKQKGGDEPIRPHTVINRMDELVETWPMDLSKPLPGG